MRPTLGVLLAAVVLLTTDPASADTIDSELPTPGLAPFSETWGRQQGDETFSYEGATGWTRDVDGDGEWDRWYCCDGDPVRKVWLPNETDNPYVGDVYADRDGDGHFEWVEYETASGYRMTAAKDSDGDGTWDHYYSGYDAQTGTFDEQAVDEDGDGIFEQAARDTDGDGVIDLVHRDVDSDGVVDQVLHDDDGDGNFERAERRLADGSFEVSEDTDGDGKRDQWSRDTDGDGQPDVFSFDDDGDGERDAGTWARDTDGDGIPDVRFTDTDGDGDADRIVASDDNGDPVPGAPIEVDRDGDGIFEQVLEDADGDGTYDHIRIDADGDGTFETTLVDQDQDGTFDTQETDRDGDGNVDEWVTDSDGDGRFDTWERDQDGDGVPEVFSYDRDGDGERDAGNWFIDTDGDGIPDLEARDTDGDGLADEVVELPDLDDDSSGSPADGRVDEECEALEAHGPLVARSEEWVREQIGRENFGDCFLQWSEFASRLACHTKDGTTWAHEDFLPLDGITIDVSPMFLEEGLQEAVDNYISRMRETLTDWELDVSTIDLDGTPVTSVHFYIPYDPLVDATYEGPIENLVSYRFSALFGASIGEDEVPVVVEVTTNREIQSRQGPLFLESDFYACIDATSRRTSTVMRFPDNDNHPDFRPLVYEGLPDWTEQWRVAHDIMAAALAVGPP